jgi:hypothetical protein
MKKQTKTGAPNSVSSFFIFPSPLPASTHSARPRNNGSAPRKIRREISRTTARFAPDLFSGF